MPIGSLSVFATMMDALNKSKPKSVLDLGMGMGIYAAGIRQWCDMGYGFRTYIEGVEIFEEYKNSSWLLYNDFTVCSIDEYLKNSTSKFDCILLMDVIEHFEKQKGFELIENIKQHLEKGGMFYIATPGIFCEQGSVHGNESEKHLSLWSSEDFKNVGFEIITAGKTPDKLGHQMVLVKYINL